MNELISQLWTPELTAGLIVVIILLLILYVLSIVWVVRDAYMRGTQWYIWAIVALVPGVGLIAYLLLRPPLLQIDRDEQELEIALKQREVMRYGECATCGYPVEADYVLCPNCLTQLKNLCRTCHKALDPAWEVCPYCATPVMGPGHRHGSSASRAGVVSSETAGQQRPLSAQSPTANPRANAAQASSDSNAAASAPSASASGGAGGVDEGAAGKGRGKSKRRQSKAVKAAAADNASAPKISSPQTPSATKAPTTEGAKPQKNNPRAAKQAKSKS